MDLGIKKQAWIPAMDSPPVAASDFMLRQVGEQIASWYWSGTEYANNSDNAWNFNMNNGNQNNNHQNNSGYGLALRSG
jgi:hypothetical protein